MGISVNVTYQEMLPEKDDERHGEWVRERKEAMQRGPQRVACSGPQKSFEDSVDYSSGLFPGGSKDIGILIYTYMLGKGFG